MKCETKEQFAEYRGILVLAEVRGGVLQDCSMELVSEARRMADRMGAGVCALLLGSEVERFAPCLAGFGADRVLVCEDALLRDYTTEAYASVACQVAEQLKPEIFLVSATTLGRALAPRCAARLKTGLNADCTLLHTGSEEYRQYLEENQVPPAELEKAAAYTGLKMTMPAFGGHMMATIICPDYRPQMATVRPGVMAQGTFDEASAAACVPEHPAFTLTAADVFSQVLETVRAERTGVDVTKADVIVAVGMGIRKDRERGLELARELADVLDGVVACTRDVMTEGWMEEDRVVGQTGKIVRPKLYVALGISGAIQHVGGMKDAECIVAVNSDKRAPIRDVADVFLAGDLFDIVPALIREARTRR